MTTKFGGSHPLNASPSQLGLRRSSDVLNSACFCLSLNGEAMERALDHEMGASGMSALVRERCPYLFAAVPVFVAAPHLQKMAQVMQAVESVVALPAYREQVLETAPDISRLGTRGPLSVFFGYDFHLNQGRLGLIEVNTNAGGAMLNALLARAQRACCTTIDAMLPALADVVAFEQRMVDMFRQEWSLSSLSGGTEHARALTSIAIVDTAPQDQYLYPEFLLFQQLFERYGIRAVIADPSALEWRDGALWHGDLTIDLVYNRLTDFYLVQPASAALREAYLQQAIVLTPHPQAHALYADKRNLALFSDAARMHALGVPEATQRILLEHVPRTEVVVAADAQRLWDSRRSLFFKPVAGFGGRAAYRGDKLTKRVWQEILAGEYVAQAIVTPGERMIVNADEPTADMAKGVPESLKTMKFDLRAYTYDGEVQWVAARLYQGQTTNFRTPGGGFAPVYSTGKAVASGSEFCVGSVKPGEGAPHASYVFLLDEGGEVHPVPHALYVALARGDATAEAMAGQTLRLADWYVRLKGDAPDAVVNETYTKFRLDAQGRVDHANVRSNALTPPNTLENPDWPSAAERSRMRALLFGEADSADAFSEGSPDSTGAPGTTLSSHESQCR